jgi:hypothetical protein
VKAAPRSNIVRTETPLEVAMLKTVLAGVTMLALAGGSFVYAQQRGDGGPRSHRWQMSEQDRGAMTDAVSPRSKPG